jgi:hypothetical protein
VGNGNCVGKEGLDLMRGIAGVIDETTSGGGSWGDILKDLTKMFGQTGAGILTAQYGTVPVYTASQSPYGASQTVYRTGGATTPTGTAFQTPIGSGISSETILLLGGAALVLVLVMGKK